MRTFKKYTISVAVLASFAIAGTIINPRPAFAQNPKPGSAPVNIVSPLPLPITGSTTVSGSVAATQSGTWNVGITGTPTVANVNVDEPGRIPYQSVVSKDNQCSSSVCAFTFGPVPLGKRLVVQRVAGSLNFASAVTAASPAGACIFVQGTSAALTCFHYSFAPQTGAFFDLGLQLYVDQGQSILVNAGAGGLNQFLSNGGQHVTLIGYLLNCTANLPCAPIAQ
jgi:hypothetical protein